MAQSGESLGPPPESPFQNIYAGRYIYSREKYRPGTPGRLRVVSFRIWTVTYGRFEDVPERSWVGIPLHMLTREP
jgi:hypothetical protein